MREGWRPSSLGKLASLITSGSRGWGEYYSDKGFPFIRMTNLTRDGIKLDLSDIRFVELPETFAEGQRTRIFKGDILISITAELGKIGFVDFEPECPSYVNQHVCLVRLNNKSVDSEFVAAFLADGPQRKMFNLLSDAGSKAGLNLKTIERFPVSVPPLCEQRKIAEILRTWDDAIEKLAAMRESKKRRLDALRNNLLICGGRASASTKSWQSCKLADVTRELTARNSSLALDREKVMGVSNSKGIVPMREQTVAEDIVRYKCLPPLAFAYNPMRINVGSIAMNNLDEEVLVSPDYVVFACEPHGLEPDYLDHLRETRWWTHHINSGGSGSVRQRTYYADLAALQLPLPDIGEQRKIVELLNLARDDLAGTKRLKIAIERQKRGLMQKLLTGEWRVEARGGYGKR